MRCDCPAPKGEAERLSWWGWVCYSSIQQGSSSGPVVALPLEAHLSRTGAWTLTMAGKPVPLLVVAAT